MQQFSVLLIRHSGLDVQTYTYYNPANCGFNAAGCYADLKVGPFNEGYGPPPPGCAVLCWMCESVARVVLTVMI